MFAEKETLCGIREAVYTGRRWLVAPPKQHCHAEALCPGRGAVSTSIRAFTDSLLHRLCLRATETLYYRSTVSDLALDLI